MSSHAITPQADWLPSPETIRDANLTWLMNEVGIDKYAALHAWSVREPAAYWKLVMQRLGIQLQQPTKEIVDLSAGVESPRWLPGARLNIVDSCFQAPADSPAIVSQDEGGELVTITVGELREQAGRVAASIVAAGWKPGDALAVYLPMHAQCVAIYLGILQAGCVAVSIADSFRPPEIAVRLRLANAKGIFTQDEFRRGGKALPLYENLHNIEAPRAVVLTTTHATELKAKDSAWDEFFGDDIARESVAREADDAVNILFSSGTTGEPKAIPWTQTTPIKAAADGHFHHDIHPGDVVVWPTNLGWMMGPWLIFASLLNRATIGLYEGAPTGAGFCRFVQDAKTTMLGLVPSLVKAWRAGEATDGLDWSGIRAFSSTGECSNAEDMRWLMQQAGGRPVIEYCGGTEIGGGYITSVVTLPNVAGAFNAPALGMDFVLLDEQGQPTNNGEVFIIPPSMGLSITLLNKDHHEVYYADSPTGPNGETLRRHGDQLEALPGGYWRAHGRVDNTMNLGGIKVSSAEIERSLVGIPGVRETAAIAVAPQGGPSQLVVFAVVELTAAVNIAMLTQSMQRAIKQELNPLFKIHEVRLIDALPRTASNKVMHRVLRDQYLSQA